LSEGADFYIAPSKTYAKTLKSAFDATDDKIILAGQPRNEIFFDNEKRSIIRETILQSLGITDINTKIIVYLPTFRDLDKKRFAFSEEYEKGTLSGSVIIEKGHFADKTNILESSSEKVFDGSGIDTQYLMMAADLLITDYSSCLFDFLITNRPVIQFVYDYEYYKNEDRGLYYSLKEMDCGYIVYNKEQLFETLKDFEEGRVICSNKQLLVKKKMIEFESKDNSEIICKFIESKS
jgi:CDP-glycerol glycerophosphotransferase